MPRRKIPTMHRQAWGKQNNECIMEYSFPSGKGGLLALNTKADGTDTVELYRHDDGIAFTIGAIEKNGGRIQPIVDVAPHPPITHHACYVETTDARIDEIVVPLDTIRRTLVGYTTAPDAIKHDIKPNMTDVPDTTTSTWEFLITWECTNQEWGALLILLLGNRRVKTIRPA